MAANQLIADAQKVKVYDESLDMGAPEEQTGFKIGDLREFAIKQGHEIKDNHRRLCKYQTKLAASVKRLSAQIQGTRDPTQAFILRQQLARHMAEYKPIAKRCGELKKMFNEVQRDFRVVDATRPKDESGRQIKRQQLVAIIIRLRGLETNAMGTSLAAGLPGVYSEMAANQATQGANNEQLKRLVKSSMATSQPHASGPPTEMSDRQFKDLPESAGVEDFKAYNTDQLMDGYLSNLKKQALQCQDLNCLGKVLKQYTQKHQAAFWAASRLQSRFLWDVCVGTVKISCGLINDPTNIINSALTRQQLAVIYHKILVPLGYTFVGNRLHLVPQCDNFRGHTNADPAKLSVAQFEAGAEPIFRKGIFRVQNKQGEVVRHLTKPDTLDGMLKDDMGLASGFNKGPGEMSLFGGGSGGAGGSDNSVAALMNVGRVGLVPTDTDRPAVKPAAPPPPPPREIKLEDDPSLSGMAPVFNAVTNNDPGFVSMQKAQALAAAGGGDDLQLRANRAGYMDAAQRGTMRSQAGQAAAQKISGALMKSKGIKRIQNRSRAKQYAEQQTVDYGRVNPTGKRFMLVPTGRLPKQREAVRKAQSQAQETLLDNVVHQVGGPVPAPVVPQPRQPLGAIVQAAPVNAGAGGAVVGM